MNASENLTAIFLRREPTFIQLLIPILQKIVVPIIYILIVICGFIGNFLVIFVFVINRTLKDSTNAFIANLAIADLMFIVFCVPFTAVLLGSSQWPYADAWCPIMTYLQNVSAFASVWTLVLLSLERFAAVVYPIKAKRWRSLKHALTACAVLWTAILSCNVPFLVRVRVNRYEKHPNHSVCFHEGAFAKTASVTEVRIFNWGFNLGAYLLPLCVTCVLYFLMIRRLWAGPFQPDKTSGRRKMSEAGFLAKKRITKMIATVTLIFAVCWLPQNGWFFYFALKYPGNAVTSETLFLYVIFAQVLAYINSCLNPILYGIMSQNFRTALKDAFKRIFSGKLLTISSFSPTNHTNVFMDSSGTRSPFLIKKGLPSDKRIKSDQDLKSSGAQIEQSEDELLRRHSHAVFEQKTANGTVQASVQKLYKPQPQVYDQQNDCITVDPVSACPEVEKKSVRVYSKNGPNASTNLYFMSLFVDDGNETFL